MRPCHAQDVKTGRPLRGAGRSPEPLGRLAGDRPDGMLGQEQGQAPQDDRPGWGRRHVPAPGYGGAAVHPACSQDEADGQRTTGSMAHDGAGGPVTKRQVRAKTRRLLGTHPDPPTIM
jgi:hypothetical protein